MRYAGASNPGDTGTLLLCRVSLGRPMLKRIPQSNLRRPPDPFPLFGWEHLTMWLQGDKFHSVFAQAGTAPAFLLMNEYIVYQCALDRRPWVWRVWKGMNCQCYLPPEGVGALLVLGRRVAMPLASARARVAELRCIFRFLIACARSTNQGFPEYVLKFELK